jgi:hypothetical protein
MDGIAAPHGFHKKFITVKKTKGFDARGKNRKLI